MAWLQYLLRVFKRQDYPAVENKVSQTPATLLPLKDIVDDPLTVSEKQEEKHWIFDEDLLRDEGVIYGLSGANPDEKIKVIRAVYKQQTTPHQSYKDKYNEQIGEANLILEQKHEQQSLWNQKIKDSLNQSLQMSFIWRAFLGLALALVLCGANYFLIRETFNIAYPGHADWIAWGVFLAGMFNLYANTALVHSDDPATLRKIAEEVGMPLAASTYVAVQSVSFSPWYVTLSLFFFVFFLFLYSGKLLLGNVSKLQQEYRIFKANQKVLANQHAALNQWKVEVENLEKEIDQLRINKWQIINKLNEAEMQIQRIQAEEDSACSLFLSEYTLAHTYKKQLSTNEISKILKND